MAWDSKCGDIIKLNENESYMHCFIHCLNTTASKTMSYKYGLIKSILDNIFNVKDLELSFDDISISFARIYWNLINKYDLPQSNSEAQPSTISKIINSYVLNDITLKYVEFDLLDDKIRLDYVLKVKKIIRKDVIGALYSDLNCNIYGFDKSIDKLWFNQSSFDFLINNKIVIEKLNYYSWIIWTENALERRNKVGNNLALKIDLSNKRKSLEYFKQKLFSQNNKTRCFYCDKEIKVNNCHIDHFIPWSFVKDDKIWNLVPTCSNCNLRKNNKIPNKLFLNKLLIRNINLLSEDFKEKLEVLYKSALINGFEEWK